VEGVGKGNIPGVMDFSQIDDCILVSDDEAFSTCHKLAQQQGLLLGGSAGTAPPVTCLSGPELRTG
jgi:cysteine synthase